MQVHEIVSNSRESLDIVLNIEKWVLPGRRTRNRVWCRWGCFYVLWVVVKWKSFRCVWLFVTPWTVTCQAPLSRAFPTQEYWSGLPCPSLGDLLESGIEPGSAAMQVVSLPSEPWGKFFSDAYYFFSSIWSGFIIKTLWIKDSKRTTGTERVLILWNVIKLV